MHFRTTGVVAGLCLALWSTTALWAQSATPPVGTHKERTPQQQRMTDCNHAADGKKGDERKTFMSSCLRGETDTKHLTTQQQRMKDCNAKASVDALSGDKRRTFMSACLKGG